MLRHLTNNIQGYRLAGEIGSSEWPIYVTDAQAARRLQFRVGYLAAVSVMPEASSLTLTINDQIVGDTPIRAVQAVETVVFDIPPGVMRPGFNSVRLSTEQRHRVDCSLEATYELWTQIDPTQTGLVLPRGRAGVTSLADLAALPPDEQGALPIRAVLGARRAPFEIERIMRAAQVISLVGRFEQPVVDIGPPARGQYGVNLVVGPAADLAGRVDLSRARPDRRAARLSCCRRARRVAPPSSSPARRPRRSTRRSAASLVAPDAEGLAAGPARRRRLPRLSARRRPARQAARSRRRQRGVHRPSVSRRLQHHHAAGFLSRPITATRCCVSPAAMRPVSTPMRRSSSRSTSAPPSASIC